MQTVSDIESETAPLIPKGNDASNQSSRGGPVHRFWLREYLGVDFRILASLRIILASLVIAKLLAMWPHIAVFYSDAGVMPRGMRLETTNFALFSFFWANGTTLWGQLHFLVHGLAAVCLLVGYRTRLSTLVTWILYLSLISGNWTLANSGDVLLSHLLLWGCFVPWGCHASLDRRLHRTTVCNGGKFAGAGAAALILQMPLVYFFSALLKGTDPSWTQDFTAVSYALSSHFATDAGQALLQSLSFEKTQHLTRAALFLEFVGPILLFLPLFTLMKRERGQTFLTWTRTAIFVAFAIFNISLALTLDVFFFQMVCIAALVPVLSWPFAPRAISRSAVCIYADHELADRYFQLLSMLTPAHVSVSAVSSGGESCARAEAATIWWVQNKKGKKMTGSSAWMWILGQTTALRWVCTLRGSAGLGNILNWITKPEFISRMKFPTGDRARLGNLSLSGSLVCGFLLIYVFASNLNSVGKMPLPGVLDDFGRSIRLTQHWMMFQTPDQRNGYYVMPGLLRDGRVIDLFAEGGPVSGETFKKVSYDPPISLTSSMYANSWWLSYFRRDFPEKYRYYGRYVAREWNSQNEGGNELLAFSIFYLSMPIDPDAKGVVQENLHVSQRWRHWCFDEKDLMDFHPNPLTDG